MSPENTTQDGACPQTVQRNLVQEEREAVAAQELAASPWPEQTSTTQVVGDLSEVQLAAWWAGLTRHELMAAPEATVIVYGADQWYPPAPENTEEITCWSAMPQWASVYVSVETGDLVAVHLLAECPVAVIEAFMADPVSMIKATANWHIVQNPGEPPEAYWFVHEDMASVPMWNAVLSPREWNRDLWRDEEEEQAQADQRFLEVAIDGFMD